MGQKRTRISREDPEIGGLSFEPVTDNEPFTDSGPAELIGRALATWLFCTIVGGIILTGVIFAVSRYFRAPEFAEFDYLGFIMGGILGLLIAVILFVNVLRREA
jgi:hypothetical protein